MKLRPTTTKKGIVTSSPDNRDYLYTPTGNPLPAVDMRPWAREIEQQGGLGACTANAAVSALELSYSRAGIEKNFSRLYVYYYIRKYQDREKYPDGGIPRNIGKALKEHGVCLAKTWPYYEDKQNVEPDYDARKNGEKYKIKEYSKIPLDDDTVKNIKLSLSNGIPVLMTFFTCTDFYVQLFTQWAKMNNTPWRTHDWDSVITKSNPRSTPHESVIIGYDDSEGRFLVENSWGTWYCGDEGFFGMPYEKVSKECAFEFWVLNDVGVDNYSFWPNSRPSNEQNLEIETEVKEVPKEVKEEELPLLRNAPVIQMVCAINIKDSGETLVDINSKFKDVPDIEVPSLKLEMSLSRIVEEQGTFIYKDGVQFFVYRGNDETGACISFSEISGQRYMLHIEFTRGVKESEGNLKLDEPKLSEVIYLKQEITIAESGRTYGDLIDLVIDNERNKDALGDKEINLDTIDYKYSISVGTFSEFIGQPSNPMFSYQGRAATSIVICFEDNSKQKYEMKVDFILSPLDKDIEIDYTKRPKIPDPIHFVAERVLTKKGKKKTNILNMFNRQPPKGMGVLPYLECIKESIEILEHPTQGTGWLDINNIKGPSYSYTGNAPDSALLTFKSTTKAEYLLRLDFVSPGMIQSAVRFFKRLIT